MHLNKRAHNVADIIVALDMQTASAASKLVTQIGDACTSYKIGLELFAAGEGAQLSKELLAHDMAVLVDLKLLDIPTTVGRATARLADMGVSALTVHANRAALDAAIAHAGAMDIFAVTLLTSVSEQELHASGYSGSVSDYVLVQAKLAVDTGCRGIVCSVREASAVRAKLGDQLVIITPGIRDSAAPTSDQVRIATAASASAAGVDYVVVGRPIRDSLKPRQSILDLRNQIS